MNKGKQFFDIFISKITFFINKGKHFFAIFIPNIDFLTFWGKEQCCFFHFFLSQRQPTRPGSDPRQVFWESCYFGNTKGNWIKNFAQMQTDTKSNMENNKLYVLNAFFPFSIAWNQSPIEYSIEFSLYLRLNSSFGWIFNGFGHLLIGRSIFALWGSAPTEPGPLGAKSW